MDLTRSARSPGQPATTLLHPPAAPVAVNRAAQGLVLLAAWTLADLVVTWLTRDSRAEVAQQSDPALSSSELRRVVDLGVGVEIGLALIVCLVCVVCARRLRRAHQAARIIATVTLAVTTMLALASISAGALWRAQSVLPAGTALIGLTVLVLVWSPPANRFFVTGR